MSAYQKVSYQTCISGYQFEREIDYRPVLHTQLKVFFLHQVLLLTINMIYYFSLEIATDCLLSFMLFSCNFFDVHLTFSVWYFRPIILRLVTFLRSYFCGIYLHYFLKITSVFLVFTLLELSYYPNVALQFLTSISLLIFIYIFCVLSCSCFFLEQ